MQWIQTHGLKGLAALVLLLWVHPVLQAQAASSYSFIVAGHAYGAHEGGNTGLHPAFLNSLQSGYDSTAAFIVLTGDIVNFSTTESWQQVEDELAGVGLPAYYVMGNHDDNDAGWQVFEALFGGTYYSFYWQNDLHIVLNSTEGDRSITPVQIDFLIDRISQAGDTVRNIFIYFHEVIWNSHEKYTGVRSNSRSRYDQMVDFSNYWEEVHPLFVQEPEKNFYVISGDVGGNPDAIAAFYDRLDNVTLLSSGMGEVADENYLLVRVPHPDSVNFTLVPLDTTLSIPDIKFYSVPPAPDSIGGPVSILPGSRSIEYTVPEVSNADAYLWDLPPGATGTSTTTRIEVTFDASFTEGELSVRAAREGFGSGPAASLHVYADLNPDDIKVQDAPAFRAIFTEIPGGLVIGIHSPEGELCFIRIMDINGRTILVRTTDGAGGYTEMQIHKNALPGGIFFLSATTRTQHLTRKFVLR
ncbi:MAG: metallophosphoesterase [Bacteroidota bacterium]